MYDLKKFSLRDMTECGKTLRQLNSGAVSMEEVANRIVRYLYEHLINQQTGENSCALIRFFTTYPYEELKPELREFADGMLGNNSPPPQTQCLTLLASAGIKPEWNAWQTSKGHKAIPLVNEHLIEQSPMISQLIKQLGLEFGAVLEPKSTLFIDATQKTFNVFYVPTAIGSPYIPAQEAFVIPYGIQSVLGFGGILPSGNLFSIILFSKVKIPKDTAELFKTLALSVKVAILPFYRRVFSTASNSVNEEIEYLRFQGATLEELLEVYQHSALEKAEKVEQTLYELRKTQSQLIQTEKMSSLGQLVAGIAHEINNPVNFISGNINHIENYVEALSELIQLYQECYPTPHSKIENKQEEIDFDFIVEDLPKVLASMKLGSNRIRTIVLSLRNFSRLDEAEVKAADIHEGIDNTLLILNHRIKQDIKVIKKYGDLPLVQCYPAQINQVLMNIINNAIDTLLESQQSRKQIIIETKLLKGNSDSLDETFVGITVKDNGAGIPLGIQKKLFDPFFTTKPIGKGTGLGLSIGYQIMQKHKGTIEVISEPGKQTEFVISLPVKFLGATD